MTHGDSAVTCQTGNPTPRDNTGYDSRTSIVFRHILFICLLLAFLWSGTQAPGEDGPSREKSLETTDYPQIDPSPPGLSSKNVTLMPWLERYHSFGGDFSKQNKLAFRRAGCYFHWSYEMLLVMANPRTSARTKQAIIHFVSASYSIPRQRSQWHRFLSSSDAEDVKGMLEILRSARTLKPDGSDDSWPSAGLLDPQRMPQRIVAVLSENPELVLDVILTLQEYGPLALKEAEALLPHLLSDDPQVAAAAQAAILKMDPQGIAKLLHLDGKPLNDQQANSVDCYVRNTIDNPPTRPVYDLRESDGATLSDMSRMRHELLSSMKYMYFRGGDFFERQDAANEFLGQRELAIHFRDQNLPGNWWRLLSLVYSEGDCYFEAGDEASSGIILHNTQTLQIASVLYRKPGSRDEMLRALHDEDPLVAAGMLNLLADMRLYKSGITEYSDGDLVDPEVIPAELVKVGERHPHLKVGVAGILSLYKSFATPQLDTIVPLLLTDNTHDIKLVREDITKIDPELAKRLEITLVTAGTGTNWDRPDGPDPLTPRQRELIEGYLKEHRITVP